MKIKKQTNYHFRDKVNSPDKVYRNIHITEDDFIGLKLKSITLGKSIYKLVDESLNEIIKAQFKIQPKLNNTVKKTISINKQTLEKVKIYAVTHKMKVQDVLLSGINYIVKSR